MAWEVTQERRIWESAGWITRLGVLLATHCFPLSYSSSAWSRSAHRALGCFSIGSSAARRQFRPSPVSGYKDLNSLRLRDRPAHVELHQRPASSPGAERPGGHRAIVRRVARCARVQRSTSAPPRERKQLLPPRPPPAVRLPPPPSPSRRRSSAARAAAPLRSRVWPPARARDSPLSQADLANPDPRLVVQEGRGGERPAFPARLSRN